MFAGQDSAIGQTLRVNGVAFTVVGVMPADFRFVSTEVQLWTPAAFSPEDRADERRHNNSWQMLARLEAGRDAWRRRSSQIDAINARNLERFPHFRETPRPTPASTRRRSACTTTWSTRARGTLWLLWAFAGFVLLIGALERRQPGVGAGHGAGPRAGHPAGARRHARVADASDPHRGADAHGRRRRARVAARVVGAAGGAAARTRCAAARRGDRPRRPVAVYTFGLVAVVGMLVAVVPVLRLRHVDVAGAIREEGRSGTAIHRTLALRRVLVAGQVAFALVLLVGAGLLLASFDRILAIDPGFRAEGVLHRADLAAGVPLRRRRGLAFGLRPAAAGAAGDSRRDRCGPDQLAAVRRRLQRQRHPGRGLPDGPGRVGDFAVADRGQRGAASKRSACRWCAAGHSTRRRRRQATPRSVIVDERVAQRFWPGQDPVGRRMYLPSDPNDLLKPPPDDQWLTVVGVVRSVRLRALADGGNLGLFGAYYFPLAQSPDRGVAIVRAHDAGDPEALTSAIRAAVREMDPTVPVYDVQHGRAGSTARSPIGGRR